MRTNVIAGFLLGLLGFSLMFALGEGVRIPASVPAAEYVQTATFVGGMGAYFLICAYLVCRGGAKPPVPLWPVIGALNAALFVTVLIALFVEPNRGAVLQGAGALLVAVLSSWAGAALAARRARS